MSARVNKEITVSPAMARRLLSAYKAARLNKKEIFVFEGNRYLTDYAMYLLRYAIEIFPSEVDLKREFEDVKQ